MLTVSMETSFEIVNECKQYEETSFPLRQRESNVVEVIDDA